MSSISIGTRKSYQSSWKMRAQFPRLRKIPPWFHTDTIGRDGPFRDFSRWGYKLTGVSHSGPVARYYDFRYMHLIYGRADIPNRAFRINDPTGELKRKSARSQELPFAIDLMTWLYKNWIIDAEINESQICIWGAVAIGFFFCMRIAEIQNLRRCDVSFSRGDSRQRLSIFFAKSKNGQGGIGISRTPAGTNNAICPVRGFAQRLLRSDWDPVRGELIALQYSEFGRNDIEVFFPI